MHHHKAALLLGFVIVFNNQYLLHDCYKFPTNCVMKRSISKVEISNIIPQARTVFQPVVQKNLKLPVWPVWAGVVAQVAEWVRLPRFAEFIVSSVGGRVVPMTLNDLSVSPFLLLAHHAHSFTPFDPVRTLTRLLLPEGFPAHPHSGFDTVTYCIDGGLRHRDSEGCKMAYGDGEVQWMRAGRGTIHEEMWNLDDCDLKHKRIEIFQLWINLPSDLKSSEPFAKIINKSSIPVIKDGHSSIRVIAGSIPINREITGRSEETDAANIGPGSSWAGSPVSILHINIPPPDSIANELSTMVLNAPADSSVFVYVRQGSLVLDNTSGKGKSEYAEVSSGDALTFRAPENYADKREESSNQGSIVLKAGERGFDGLVLIGDPLREPVYWRGPLVAASEQGFMQSARVFDRIGAGAFWDFRTPDTQWTEHCKRLNLQKLLQPSSSTEFPYINDEKDMY